jgi:hypothetical protein
MGFRSVSKSRDSFRNTLVRHISELSRWHLVNAQVKNPATGGNSGERYLWRFISRVRH